MRPETGLRCHPPGCAHAGGGWVRNREIDQGTRTISAHPDHLPDGRLRRPALGVSRVRGGSRGLHRQAAGAGNPEVKNIGFVELYIKNAVLIREIADRKLAEEHSRKSEENLRALAAHLQSVREEEWTRIAREIHDELGQSLTGLKMDLTWVVNRLPGDQRVLAERKKSMFGLIDGTIQSMRKIASRLRPEVLDQLGLTAAIGWCAGDFRKRTGIRCKLSLPSDTLILDHERSTAAFRIFQELLTNVARHANATRIDVAMRVDSGALVLTVEDNGRGIAESAIEDSKSLGLLGMRERVLPFGGAIEIAGARDKGTKVRVCIPLGLK